LLNHVKELIVMITRTCRAVLLNTLIQPTLHQNLIVAGNFQLSSQEERLSFPRSLGVGVDLKESFRCHKHEIRILNMFVIPMEMETPSSGFSARKRIVVTPVNLPIHEAYGLSFLETCEDLAGGQRGGVCEFGRLG
jgi:hypothetical protein